jgi:hypothetical protein
MIFVERLADTEPFPPGGRGIRLAKRPSFLIHVLYLLYTVMARSAATW